MATHTVIDGVGKLNETIQIDTVNSETVDDEYIQSFGREATSKCFQCMNEQLRNDINRRIE